LAPDPLDGVVRVLTAECVALYGLLLDPKRATRRELAERLAALRPALEKAAGPIGYPAWRDVAEEVVATSPGLLDG
jgi:hypothetical protein